MLIVAISAAYTAYKTIISQQTVILEDIETKQ